jgi:hypothetical protein
MNQPSFTNLLPSIKKTINTALEQARDLPTILKPSKTFLLNVWNKYISYHCFGVILFLLSIQEELIKFTAILYVLGVNLFPPVAALSVLYFLSNFLIKSKKPITDATNVNLFDRGFALSGLILPCAEFSRFFPNEIKQWPVLYHFQVEYLTGLIMLLNLNELFVILLQVVCFRELIRRRGPDTEWIGAGAGQQKVWVKYFIRYYWCYGFCVTTLLEPFNFIKMKVIELLQLPNWIDTFFNELAFYTLGCVIVHAIIYALIGIPNKMPLLHGACEFHVGRPKKI